MAAAITAHAAVRYGRFFMVIRDHIWFDCATNVIPKRPKRDPPLLSEESHQSVGEDRHPPDVGMVDRIHQERTVRDPFSPKAAVP